MATGGRPVPADTGAPSPSAAVPRGTPGRRSRWPSSGGLQNMGSELVKREGHRGRSHRDEVVTGSQVELPGDDPQPPAQSVSDHRRADRAGYREPHTGVRLGVVRSHRHSDRTRPAAPAIPTQRRERSLAAKAPDAPWGNWRHRTEGVSIRPTGGGDPCDAAPEGSPAQRGWPCDAGSHGALLACGCWADTCASLMSSSDGAGCQGLAVATLARSRRADRARAVSRAVRVEENPVNRQSVIVGAVPRDPLCRKQIGRSGPLGSLWIECYGARATAEWRLGRDES